MKKQKNTKPELVRAGENYWMIKYPACVHERFEEFWNAVEQMHSNPSAAEEGLKKLITECPNAHMDALLHLGFLLNETGRDVEGAALISKAYSIALQAIPDDFDDEQGQIPWGIMENRPFLRAFHAEILEMMKNADYAPAADKCGFVLGVNPNDNQGIRYLLMECFFHQGEPKAVLDLIQDFEEEGSADFAYGAVLAHLQLKNTDQAKKKLESALAEYPKVGKEIIKKRHTKPRNQSVTGGIILGSAYEAYDYWQRNGKFWEATNGAIEWVSAGIK